MNQYGSKKNKKSIVLILILCFLLFVALFTIIREISKNEHASTSETKTVETTKETKMSYEILENSSDNTVIISLIVKSESGIKQIELPNGTVQYFNGDKEATIEYTVNKNANYTFKVTDLDGNITKKIINVSKLKEESNDVEKVSDDSSKENDDDTINKTLNKNKTVVTENSNSKNVDSSKSAGTSEVVKNDDSSVVTVPDAGGNITIALSTEQYTKSLQINLYDDLDGKYDIYYKLGKNGDWEKYISIVQIDQNTTVYVRYQDADGNVGSEISKQITNIDTTAPNNYSPEVSSTTHSITINGATIDNKSTSSNLKYYYSIDDGDTYTNDEGTTYTFDDLTQNKSYTVTIKVVDEASNERMVELEGNTLPVPSYDINDIVYENKVVTANNIDSEYNLLYAIGENGTFSDYTAPIEINHYGQFVVKFKYLDIKDQEGQEIVYEQVVPRMIYFQKPNEWSTPYAYLTGDISLSWPGISLTQKSGNVYYFEITDDMMPGGVDESSLSFSIQFNNGGSVTNSNGSYKYKLRTVDFDGFDKIYTVTSGSTTTNESSTGVWNDYEERDVLGRIYFNKPVGWDYPHAYLYKSDTSTTEELLENWPGVELTREEDYIYYFEITTDMLDSEEDISNYMVTFNNGGSTYNQSHSEYKYKLADVNCIGFDKIYNPTSNLYTTEGDSTGEWLNYDSDTKIGKIPTTSTKVKNVIFMIGDGMGENHIRAAEIYKGEKLNIQKISDKTYVTTGSTKTITDSAAAATALATGYKTTNGTIGKDKKGRDVQNIVEYTHLNGLKTGIVVTQILNHATPAGFTIHNASRNNYDEIAKSQITSNVDLMLGGGTQYFSQYASLMQSNNITYINQLSDISGIDANKRVIGTFATESISEVDGTRTSLKDMTTMAFSRLENENGFFLMIEGSDIDSYSHSIDMPKMLTEMIDFDEAVGAAIKYVDEHEDTLLVITADHEAGGLNLDGITSSEQLENSLFTSGGAHTETNVLVYAYGLGAQDLTNYDLIDNTSIFKFIKQALARS